MSFVHQSEFLTAGALLALAFVPTHAPQWLPLTLVGGVPSYSSVLIRISRAPCRLFAAATRRRGGIWDVIDSVGYLAAVFSGNDIAYLVVTLGWKVSFLVLASVAVLSSVAAITLVVRQMWPDRADRSNIGETIIAFSDRS